MIYTFFLERDVRQIFLSFCDPTQLVRVKLRQHVRYTFAASEFMARRYYKTLLKPGIDRIP